MIGAYCPALRIVLTRNDYLFEDGTRGAAATRKRTPSTRICTKLRVRCDFFLHQRNEWHNEATPINVRAVSVSLPAGFCG